MYNEFMAEPEDNFHLEGFHILESGTYNPMYARPYQVEADNRSLEKLANVVEEVDHVQSDPAESMYNASYLGSIDPRELIRGASGIIRPSAMPKAVIDIPEGWDNDRLTFVAIFINEIMGSTFAHYVQGYTDYHDPSMSGLIDPRTRFYINSIMTVKRVPDRFGGYVERLIENNNLLYVPVSDDVDDGKFTYANPGTAEDKLYTARPTDVYNTLTSSLVVRTIAENQGLESYDYTDAKTVLSSRAAASNRSNDIGPEYLTKIVNSVREAMNTSHVLDSNEARLNKAKGKVGEINLANNPLLRMLGWDNMDSVFGVSFTMEELVSLFPNAPEIMTHYFPDPTDPKPIHETGMTEEWSGATPEVQLSTIVSDSVASLATRYFLTEIHFTMTNETLTGNVEHSILSANSFSKVNIGPNCDMFISDFIDLVFSDISSNGYIDISLEVSLNIFRDIWIDITVNGGEPYELVKPIFCNSLGSSVVVPSYTNYRTLVNDLDEVMSVSLPG